MKVAALKETWPGEARVAMTPESALALQKLGHDCLLVRPLVLRMMTTSRLVSDWFPIAIC